MRNLATVLTQKPFILIASALLIACQASWATPIETAPSLPQHYNELNDYVVTSPNQGQADSCVYMASTGAMEILLSKKMGIRFPQPLGKTDLSERFTISAPVVNIPGKTWFENIFLKFSSGVAVLAKDLPFEFYDADGNFDYSVWNYPVNLDNLPRITLPKVDTVLLFSVGNQFSRNVLDESHVKIVKEALLKYRSPILTIGNDEEYWHAIVITGYDDNATDGDCYELATSVCAGKRGAFYVRDSFGIRVEKRSYQWFIKRMNSAAVTILVE